MSKWLNQFLENEIVNRSDKSARFEKGANLSGLSGLLQGLLDGKKVENNLRKGGDKSDRFKFEPNMSPLSLRTQGLLDENLEKVENNPETGTDKTDKPINEGPLSVLSVRPLVLLDEKMVNMPFTFSNGSGLLDEYEERRSIAEYDGHQTSIQAQRIAYLDTFLAVLASLPYENTTEDWLSHRIRTAQKWLLDQGVVQPS